MQVARVAQHCEGALEPVFSKVLGERLSRPLQEQLNVSSRQAERAGHMIEIEVWIAEPLPDPRQDRPQPRRLYPTFRNDLLGFAGRSEHCSQLPPGLSRSVAFLLLPEWATIHNKSRRADALG